VRDLLVNAATNTNSASSKKSALALSRPYMLGADSGSNSILKDEVSARRFTVSRAPEALCRDCRRILPWPMRIAVQP
jgi:hypothetical protein